MRWRTLLAPSIAALLVACSSAGSAPDADADAAPDSAKDSDSSPDSAADPDPPPDLTAFVDPFIGTAGEGNTYPGAQRPWGLASASPHNSYSTPLDYLAGLPITPSGYRYGEPLHFGFGFTHLSGVGCPDLGAPVVALVGDAADELPEDYGEPYGDETATAGYYATTLTERGVRVEATATERVGVLRYTFPPDFAGPALLRFDTDIAISWNRDEGSSQLVGPRAVEGSVTTGLFCAQQNTQTLYFSAQLSRDAVETETPGTLAVAGVADGALEVAVGLSWSSLAGARANLEAELGDRDFDQVREEARDAWQSVLSRLHVEGGDDDLKTMVYTALYHLAVHPNLFSDAGEAPRYTVYSMWDSYRNVHPLLALLYPERAADMLAWLAELTLDWGAPPKWELMGQEVQMMVGDPALPVFADGLAKGLFDAAGVDPTTLYPVLRDAALREEAPLHRPGNASYLALGYVPMEEASTVWGPVSTTLEYAYADWSLARLAEAAGEPGDAALFDAQAARWTELFDPETGLLRPKMADGSWYEPFEQDAIQGSNDLYDPSGGPGFVEGTAWHYAFFVLHDIEGLIAAHGGPEPFESTLEAAFDTPGRFVMWNEPDIHQPWLFSRLDKPERTAARVREAALAYFDTTPEGLPGNDDAGTLSAWLVFAALGFYPDPPGSPDYALGAPLFDRVELRVPGREPFAIALDEGADPTARLTHWRILEGGTLNVRPGPR